MLRIFLYQKQSSPIILRDKPIITKLSNNRIRI